MNLSLIGIAVPWNKADRSRLEQALGREIRSRARPGSTIGHCPGCNIPIVVGPRLQASGLKIICGLCAHALGMKVPYV